MDKLTGAQVESLLYGETTIELDGITINGWFDSESGVKNIDMVWQTPHREVSFVANGMSTLELRQRLEGELIVYAGVFCSL